MTSQPNPRANYVLVESLESSIQRGGASLADVPGLLKRVLNEGAWREFITRRGEHVRHDRWSSFVTTPPLGGLGASEALIERIAGTDDPDLLRLLREVSTGKPGRPAKGEEKPSDSNGFSARGDAAAYTAERLSVTAPDEYAAVQRGEKTINAAAISAGIRRRRIPVRLDSPESAAETLRKHMPPDTRRALARLLIDDLTA
jgi:hypothetical protein